MPESVSEERTELLRAFGAEIVYSDGVKGTNGSIEVAQEIAAEDPTLLHAVPVRQRSEPARALRDDRAGDPARPAGHRRVRRGPGHGRHADRRRALPQGEEAGRQGRRRCARTRAISCRACAAWTKASSRRCSTRSILDGKIVVDSRTSFASSKELTQKEGIFAGISAGAALKTAQRVAERLDSRQHRCLFADGGWKYLSTHSGRPTTRTCRRTSKTRSGGDVVHSGPRPAILY